jgi:hypothetical protein
MIDGADTLLLFEPESPEWNSCLLLELRLYLSGSAEQGEQRCPRELHDSLWKLERQNHSRHLRVR